MRAASSPPVDFDRVLRLVPGYDPFRDADGYIFDEETAQTACDFFPEVLTHVKGELAGEPFGIAPWQQAIVANLFGWKSKETGYRRYSIVFGYVPRKNGKTSLVAGITLLVLMFDGEPGAELYSAAAERKQAALIFQQAAGMIRNSAELSSRLRVYQNSVAYEDTNSMYQPISAEAGSKHGFNVHFAAVDELHAQPNRDLVDALETAMGARRQPILFHITTADYDRPSICNETLEYARRVRDGIIPEPTFLPVIYEAEREEDWHSEDVWRRVNPNLEISVSMDYLRKKHRKAVDDPAFENTFKRLYLNVVTEQDVRLLSLAEWDASAGEPISMTEIEGRVAFGALDLSTTTDLTAWVLLFPPGDPDDPFVVVPRFFLPADNVREASRRDRVPYEEWARDGLVHLTAGNQVDYRAVRKTINDDAERFSIMTIGYDPYNASHIVTELGEEDGFDLVAVRQGMATMSPATKETKRIIGEGGLRHGGNPVLRWQASNVAGKTDYNENVMPDKAKSNARIDGIVGTIMGVALSMANPGAGSRYDDGRGILTVDLGQE